LGAAMGILRKAIVLGGIILAMPSPPAKVQTTQMAPAMADSTSWNYIAAAADTVADVKNFCDRKPQVCITARYIAVTMEGKAKYSARLLYEWASESTAGQTAMLPKNLAAADPINTSSMPAKLRGTLAENSTLKIEDLVPEWHGTLSPDKG
jgi:Family of unknown function (DUF5330)